MTGVGQVAFPGAADGSRIERGGRTVGSSLIGQDFKRDPRYFQSRPSATGYDPAGDVLQQPRSQQRRSARPVRHQRQGVPSARRTDNPGLQAQDVPVDAVQTSASGVDPHISPANADIQAARVARVRGLPLDRVKALVDDNTDGRSLGVLGEPGVNVLDAQPRPRRGAHPMTEHSLLAPAILRPALLARCASSTRACSCATR